MTHYILLSVQLPNPDAFERTNWTEFYARAQTAVLPEGAFQPAVNVWLLPRDAGMPFVAKCMGLAAQYNLPVSTQFLRSDDD
jgi:hypothetical protein